MDVKHARDSVIVLIWFSLYFTCGETKELQRNERPIVGILAQDLDDVVLDSFGNIKYTSYIRAQYVKFIESGGARVVPVLINQSNDYYQMMFRSINGLIIPGGHIDFENSGSSYFIIKYWVKTF